MDNGNDPPARTSNLEFSDENRKSLNSGLRKETHMLHAGSDPEVCMHASLTQRETKH